MLIQFYKLLLDKKESLLFLKNIKDTYMNNNENTKDFDNLLNIYIFFKNILNNKEIKSDKDFLKAFNEELERNDAFRNNLTKFKNKFFNFIGIKKPIVNFTICSTNKIIINNDISKNNKNEIFYENNKNRNNINMNFNRTNVNNNIINNNNSINMNININNMNLKSYQFLISFNYNSNIIGIQCNLNEKMKDIINRYITKSLIDKKNIYFLYGGNIINEELFLSDITSQEDKKRKHITILAVSNLDNQDNQRDDKKSIIKPLEVICPLCHECINLKIKNYIISLLDCKNHHLINDILFKDFSNIQNIDLKKLYAIIVIKIINSNPIIINFINA